MTTVELEKTQDLVDRKRKSLRREIRFWLDQVDDVEFLRTVRALARNKAASWDELPEHVREDIEEGERQLDAGRGVPHEIAIKRLRRCLKES